MCGRAKVILLAVVTLLHPLCWAEDGDDSIAELGRLRRLCVVRNVTRNLPDLPVIRLTSQNQTVHYQIARGIRRLGESFERVIANGNFYALQTPASVIVRSVLGHPLSEQAIESRLVTAAINGSFAIQSISRNGEWVFVRRVSANGGGALLHLPTQRIVTNGFEHRGPTLTVQFSEDSSTALCNRGQAGGVDFFALSAPAAERLAGWHLPGPDLSWQFRFVPGMSRLITFTTSGGPFIPTMSRVRPGRRGATLERGRSLDVPGGFTAPLPSTGILQYEKVIASPSGRYLIARKIFRQGAEVFASGVDVISTFSNTRVASLERIGVNLSSLAISPNERLVALGGPEGLVVFDLNQPELPRFEADPAIWNRRSLTGLTFANDETLVTIDADGTVASFRLDLTAR